MAKKSGKEPTPAEIHRVMKHLSDLGAAKGGKARAEKLTADRPREIARKAARARWEKERGEE